MTINFYLKAYYCGANSSYAAYTLHQEVLRKSSQIIPKTRKFKKYREKSGNYCATFAPKQFWNIFQYSFCLVCLPKGKTLGMLLIPFQLLFQPTHCGHF